MRIWLINHYAVPPQYYPLARPYNFARNLVQMGHEVVIIAASTAHNSSINLIMDGSKIKTEKLDGIQYLYIKCSDYVGNGIKRVINIIEFARKLPKVCDGLKKPDAIVSTSFDPLSCYQGVRFGKKHGIKSVAEIADLWPETLVAYSSLSTKNPLVKALRRLEKKIYTKADAIVFTAAGEYDYIIDQGWEAEIPREKTYYINNGIDLAQFDENKEIYQIEDVDLSNPDIFKVVYTGSIRRVNNVSGILDIAKTIKNPKVKFLIWGDGDEVDTIKGRILNENITNVCLKGKVEKKYIPFIVSSADLNYAHNGSSPLFKYGISFNKVFDYLAAGKPIICDFFANYNPVLMCNAGVSVDSADPGEVGREIDRISMLDVKELQAFGHAARKGAEEYDFKILTKKLLEVIEEC